jgi:hypothetical protein
MCLTTTGLSINKTADEITPGEASWMLRRNKRKGGQGYMQQMLVRGSGCKIINDDDKEINETNMTNTSPLMKCLKGRNTSMTKPRSSSHALLQRESEVNNYRDCSSPTPSVPK